MLEAVTRSKLARAVLVGFAATSMGCEDELVSVPGDGQTIVGMALVAVGDPRAYDADRPVPCARVGEEIELVAYVMIRARGDSFDGAIAIEAPSCRADGCLALPVDADWVVPRIAVSSALPGRVEVDARIIAGGVSEVVHTPIDFQTKCASVGVTGGS